MENTLRSKNWDQAIVKVACVFHAEMSGGGTTPSLAGAPRASALGASTWMEWRYDS